MNRIYWRTLTFKKSVICLIKVNYTSYNYTLGNSTWTCLLENAAENLMQHLSVDHLDMLHYRFMTGKLDFCFCDYLI
jgi:hypothetical protein